MPNESRSLNSTSRPRKRGKSLLAGWVWILGFCVAVLVATYMIFVEPPPPRKLTIATGSKNGGYNRFATVYADALRKDGISVEVRETAGSVENLKLLADDKSGVTVAIVQSGVASQEQLPRFNALASLYREPLWVFYRGDEPISQLSQLAGKRVGVGPSGSGTHAVAMQLLAANGLGESSAGRGGVTLIQDDVATAAKALKNGEIDAAFFVAAFEAEYIRDLLKDPQVRLTSFDQREAYHRRFRFLAPVTVPRGLVDLGKNVPSKDVALLAPTAQLIVRKDFHPALASLLLTTAAQIHGKGDEISEPGEFPSKSYCDFPLSEDARHYFRSGPTVLQRLLPFWLASLIDRAKVMLIPVIVLMMPLLRAAPPIMRWRTRRKIYRWYSDLREIDQQLVTGMPASEVDVELARIRDIENQVAHIDVPLSYMEEFYHLRLHIEMLEHDLIELKARTEAGAAQHASEQG